MSGECTVCVALAREAADYVRHAFGNERRLALTIETMVDSAGMCSPHARALSRRPEFAGNVGRVFCSSIAKVEELLGDEHHYIERLQQIFFAAGDACPACWFDQHRAAIQLHKLDAVGTRDKGTKDLAAVTLCMPHFRQIAQGMRPDSLSRVIERQLKVIGSVKAELAPTGAHRRDLSGNPVEKALRLLRGVPPESEIAMQEKKTDAAACPACHEMRRVEQRAIEDLPKALSFGSEYWLTLPDCPLHLWASVREHDVRVGRIAVRHACDNSLRHLRRLQASVAHLLQQIEEARLQLQSPRSSRRPLRAGPPPPARILSRGWRCPVCERIAIAHDVVLERVLATARRRKEGSAFQEARRLCLKHFADAYAFTAERATRQHLMEAQRSELHELRTRLDRELALASRPAGRKGKCADGAAWLEALRRFSGA